MSTTPPGPWCCRPSYFAARVFCLALGMSAVVGGFVAYAASGLRDGLWMPGSVLAGMWLGLWAGPRLLRFAERRGWFGRIRVFDNRLQLGWSSRMIDLTEPMQVEARFQRSTIMREYSMRHLLSGVTGRLSTMRDRKYRFDVTVLTLAVEQSGRRLELVADETSTRPGREFDAEGLMIRRVAIGPPRQHPRARLLPADLAELLQLLQQADGYQAVTSAVPDEALEDPRKAICPTWKLASGVAGVLVVSVALAAAAFNYHWAQHNQHTRDLEAAAESERDRLQAEAETLIGRRVTIPVRENTRIAGRVTKVEMKKDVTYYPEYSIQWRAELTVEIDIIHDDTGSAVPEGAAIAFRHADDLVEAGDSVEVYISEVEDAGEN